MNHPYESPHTVNLVTGKRGLITSFHPKGAGYAFFSRLSTSTGIEIYTWSDFLTIQSSTLINTGIFMLPQICVKCGNRAESPSFLSARSLRRPFGISWFGRRQCLPYCEIHSRHGYPGAVISSNYLTTHHATLTCVAQSEVFIQELAKLIARGELAPPWVAFRGSDPYLGWGQGVNESWRHFTWAPFWNRLSAEERTSYAARWQMPEEWYQLLFEGK